MVGVRRRYGAIIVQGSLLLLSVAIARAVVETQAIPGSSGTLLLGAAAAVIGLGVMLIGPIACLAAIPLLTSIRQIPTVSLGGVIDLTVADAFFAALVAWWVIRLATREPEERPSSPMRHGAALFFLAFVGVSLLHVAIIDPGRLPVSFVSWLRLVQTASIGALAAYFIRTRRDVGIVLGALAVAGVVVVVRGLAGGLDQSSDVVLGARGGGFNPNIQGLLAGLLLLMAAFGALGPSPLYRLPLAVVGVIGLMQGRSLGALVGTAVALLLGLAFSVSPPKRILTVAAFRGAMALGIALVIAYSLAAAVRPQNLPTSEAFTSSSGGQRTVLGAAGLELAERNPVLGVGWRRSELPEVIGDPDLNTELRARFASTESNLFPDAQPTSVHNAYIQVAADLGLVGLGLLAVMLWAFWRGIRAVLAHAPRGSPERAQLWFMAWGVLLILVWLNDNPIFGGQTETVLLATFLGAITSLGARLTAADAP